MTPFNEAAVAEGKAAAQAGMQKIERGLKLTEEGRAQRDAGIKQMFDAGASLAEIQRDMGIPKSTVRQSLRMAAIRSMPS